MFESDVSATIDVVYDELCKRHAEYKRKPRNLFQKTIATCLVHLREAEPVVPLMEANEGSLSGEDEGNDVEEEEEVWLIFFFFYVFFV